MIAFFLLLTTHVSYVRARELRNARRDPFWKEAQLNLETAAALRSVSLVVFKGLSSKRFNEKLPELALGIWRDIPMRFPSGGKMALLMLGYLLLWIGIAFLLVIAVRHLGKPQF